ncbi:hypothetical protein [Bradyrhizobium jicamae]|uniref:hypothetical protein n=1 Tax=Bradyrhizobium jicamae TaxID=280332 RepID=UPI001BADB3C8|nr:hypothetical protein [Bradyrhizobium jicamae]
MSVDRWVSGRMARSSVSNARQPDKSSGVPLMVRPGSQSRWKLSGDLQRLRIVVWIASLFASRALLIDVGALDEDDERNIVRYLCDTQFEMPRTR